MAYTYTINDDATCDIFEGKTKVDTVGAFDTKENADAWGAAVVAKYNAPEYAKVKYPNDLPE